MSFDNEFEHAIRIITNAMPVAEKMVKPTLLHSIRVGLYLCANGYNREICLAGLLHDALEDTSLKTQDLAKDFGESVVNLVKANTKDGKIISSEQGTELIRRCADQSQDALIVKAADVMDNLSYFYKTKQQVYIQKLLRYSQLVMQNRKSNYDDQVFAKLEELSLRISRESQENAA